MNKEKLELRKRIKIKKPTFHSQDSHKRKRIMSKWRKPKGWQSKIRLNRRSYNKTVRPGYGSPKEVYALDPSGLEQIQVYNESDVVNIQKESQGIIIGSSVGKKKKIVILNKAKELGIQVLNVKDTDAYIKQVEDLMKKKKETKRKKLQRKK